MQTTFIFFDTLFRFLAVGMLYMIYKVVREAWYDFTHLDELPPYDDYDYDDDECPSCGVLLDDFDSVYTVHGRVVCDNCVF